MNHMKTLTRERVKYLFPVVAIVVPLLIFTVCIDRFAGVLLTRVVTMMFINMVLVVGLQTFMGNSGVASFGHVGFMLIGAYGSILLTMTSQQKTFTLPDMPASWWIHNFNLPFLPSLVVTGLVAAVVAAVIGVPLIRIGRVTFGMASFALLIVIRIIALSSDPLTRGTRTVVGITRLTTLWNAAIWALLICVASYVFKESGLGLKLRASREEESAAASIGINTVRLRWMAWVISTAMVAIGGGLWAHYVTVFSPHAFWVPTNFLLITMLVVGGQGSVSGAVLGTVVVTAVSEGLRALEYAVNIQRQTSPFLATVFPQQVVGLTEFVLAIVLLLILYRGPAGIVRGLEFSWPLGRTKAGASVLPETGADGRTDAFAG